MEDALSNHAFYQHAKRPEWGVAVVVDVQDDRKTFLFNDGEKRTFMNDYTSLMSYVELEEDAATEARRYFDKHAPKGDASPRKQGATATKAKRRKKKAASK